MSEIKEQVATDVTYDNSPVEEQVLITGAGNDTFVPDEEEIMTLNDLETMYIRSVLLKLRNKSKVARALGISLKTLYNKLHKTGMFEEFAEYGINEKAKE